MTSPLPIRITDLNLLTQLVNEDIFLAIDKSDTAQSNSGSTKQVSAQVLKNYIFSNLGSVSVNALSDVDTSSQVPTNGQILTWYEPVGFIGKWIPGAVTSYSLPIATSSALGGIKVGTGLSIDSGGILTAIGASYSLPIATSSALGGIKVGTGLSIDSGGILTATGASYSLPIATSSALGGIKVGTGLSIDSGGILTATGARNTKIITTASLINNNTAADGALDITAVAKTYALLKISTSAAAWVTLYTDSASRSSDATRTETTDPLPGSGVIVEVITTSGSLSQIITPGVVGWNNDGTPSSTVYAKVVNKSGSSAAITVTLNFVSLEA